MVDWVFSRPPQIYGQVPLSRIYFSLQQSLPQALPASLQHSAQDLPLSEQHFLQASPARRLVETAARARMERIVFILNIDFVFEFFFD